MKTRPFPSPATLRWTALAAAAVCLLSAASLNAADKNPEYISLAGVKAAGFQKFLDDARDQGYEPAYINGYDVGDHPEFAGVAVRDPDHKTFEANFDMDEDENSAYFRKMSDKGFRPNCVAGYHTHGGPRFAAVWVKDNVTNPWKYELGQTEKEFGDSLASLRDKGMFPQCITAYQAADGGVRYTSLFYEPGPKAKWENLHNLTAKQLSREIDNWRDRGFVLQKLHAYDTPDGLRFLAIARKGPQVVLFQEFDGLSGKEYQTKFDELRDKGYRPNCICGYREDGEVKFAANWVKRE